ncbi:MAG: sigma-70 family RNA polymerase sigma factor [Deltaproteobacteria bacterium]|nr:sigma-70 family RNA polymerase sigma factor [Deltaproteobacteria bacterium]
MATSSGELPKLLSDADLVSRCQQGDRDAQGDFYRRYRDDVLRTLYRVLGPNGEVEDALQDVFIEVFRSLPRFRGQSKISTWLYRVCVNVGLQRIRRKRRRPEGYTSLKEDLPDHETPLRALERRDSSRQVYAILDTIAPKKRVVFILSDIVGMNAKEISDVVQSNALTVRTRLHYARKEFYRKAIESEAWLRQKDAPVDARGGQS